MGLREGHRSSLVTLSQDIGLDQLTDQFIGFLDRPLQFSLTSPGIAEAESVHQMSQRHGDVRGLHPLSFTNISYSIIINIFLINIFHNWTIINSTRFSNKSFL
jgi:hypothetical protein